MNTNTAHPELADDAELFEVDDTFLELAKQLFEVYRNPNGDSEDKIAQMMDILRKGLNDTSMHTDGPATATPGPHTQGLGNLTESLRNDARLLMGSGPSGPARKTTAASRDVMENLVIDNNGILYDKRTGKIVDVIPRKMSRKELQDAADRLMGRPGNVLENCRPVTAADIAKLSQHSKNRAREVEKAQLRQDAEQLMGYHEQGYHKY